MGGVPWAQNMEMSEQSIKPTGKHASAHGAILGGRHSRCVFLGDDSSRIHSPEDKLEFVRPELLGPAVAMAVALLDQLDARARD